MKDGMQIFALLGFLQKGMSKKECRSDRSLKKPRVRENPPSLYIFLKKQ